MPEPLQCLKTLLEEDKYKRLISNRKKSDIERFFSINIDDSISYTIDFDENSVIWSNDHFINSFTIDQFGSLEINELFVKLSIKSTLNIYEKAVKVKELNKALDLIIRATIPANFPFSFDSIHILDIKQFKRLKELRNLKFDFE